MKTKTLLIALLVFTLSQVSFIYSQDTQTKESQSKMTPQSALQMLKDGNKRFLTETEVHRDLIGQVHKTADGQFPFAIILSCIDSRTSSELLFDQGIGDVFNTRIAGNIIDEDILGGMEYSCKVVGAKLILVVGHTHCGAIKGACDDVKLGNLTALVSKIKGPVQSVKTEKGEERTSKNHEFVEHVAKANVLNSIAEIKSKSSILKEMVDKGEIMIVGAMYDVDTGEVTFY
jgi:carbonic anhydrase